MVEGTTQTIAMLLPPMARIGGILACAWPFAHPAVPRKVRAMLAVALTIGLAPTFAQMQPPASVGGLLVAVAGEALIGLAIGLAMSLVFVAAQWAGEIIATQLGLSLGEVFDPNTGEQIGPLGQAYGLLGIVVFLAVQGHHSLVRGISATFTTLPAMRLTSGGAMLDMFVGMLASATSLALRLAAPVFVTMLIVDVVVGMVARTTPQVGLMTAGVAVRSLVGLIVLILAMALAVTVLQSSVGGWFASIQTALAGR